MVNGERAFNLVFEGIRSCHHAMSLTEAVCTCVLLLGWTRIDRFLQSCCLVLPDSFFWSFLYGKPNEGRGREKRVCHRPKVICNFLQALRTSLKWFLQPRPPLEINCEINADFRAIIAADQPPIYETPPAVLKIRKLQRWNIVNTALTYRTRTTHWKRFLV